ncbi:iron-containing alcohol dehydrogenase [Clostridium ihumii]|uniref:iron-containing alcohol dehydrogenase n=1 Tax=Clostridium ihumii TaxID=1470356 RepID=UPI00058D30BE|nr:iron-containing alcohol dehydrogenase [Clostridium ihumii]
MWEKTMPVNEVREIITKTHLYLGAGAIQKFNDIAKDLVNKGIKKVAILTGKAAYIKTGAWDVVSKALEENGIEYLLYNKITPNPNSHDCDEARDLAVEFGAEAIIGIGGGSPIDSAKSVAIMCCYKENTTADLYEYKFTPDKALPIIAINTTHGTGTEVDRFAVVSLLEKEYKPAIAYEVCYPMYAIDDPNLMVGLGKGQTCYTSVDAVNHVVEAATSLVTSPYCVMLAKETIRLVHQYLPVALEEPNNIEARYFLTYASMIGGVCFDNGMLHYTHALEHPLSAVKPDITHGLGLAVLLPAVIRHIYPACSEVLAEILRPIVQLEGKENEAEEAALKVKEWLVSVGIKETLKDLGFTEKDVPKLVELAFTTPSLDLLLSLAPVKATKEVVEAIYRESL